MKVNRSILITGIVTLGIGLLIGALFLGGSPDSSASLDRHEGEGHQLEQTASGVWTCSMHPQIRQSEPGDCPLCGMDLIPVSNESQNDDPKMLKMSNAAIALANIQTSIIGQGNVDGGKVLNGRIKADERRVNVQTTHFAARIEKLYKNFEGQEVRKGEKIAALYSPELVTAQEELIEAKKVEDSNPVLLEAARRKLHHWKLSMEQIQEIENSSKPLRTFDLLSDYDGIITNKMVNNGDHLKEGGVLMEITDLSKVWAVFEVYETGLKDLRVGQRIEFSPRSNPSQTFSGKIDFIEPTVNSNRVVEVRLDVTNTNGALKPDMFLKGSLYTPSNSDVLLVPKSAVLWTGERSVVYTKVSDGTEDYFQLKEVTLGETSGDYYLVKNGVSQGDEVVTNGAFTLDSESQLRGKVSMMNRGKEGDIKIDGGFTPVELPSSKDFKNKITPPFQEQLGGLTEAYIKLKDQMVQGESKPISVAAKAVVEALAKVDMSLTKDDAHIHWMALLNPMEESLKNMLNSTDRDEQRLQFINLSKAIINSVQSFGTDINNPLYVQFCPMANNNKGATWISIEENIVNPYFGDMMLTCGSVESVIQK